jgi:hypothetical protein
MGSNSSSPPKEDKEITFSNTKKDILEAAKKTVIDKDNERRRKLNPPQPPMTVEEMEGSGVQFAVQYVVCEEVYFKLERESSNICDVLEPMLYGEECACEYFSSQSDLTIENQCPVSNKFVSTALVSSLIYTLATLHKLLLEDNKFSAKAKYKKYLMKNNGVGNKFLEKIAARNLLGFIGENIEMIDNIEDYREGESEAFASKLNVTAILGLSGLKNAYIHNFDDNDSNTQMVYGICVNE